MYFLEGMLSLKAFESFNPEQQSVSYSFWQTYLLSSSASVEEGRGRQQMNASSFEVKLQYLGVESNYSYQPAHILVIHSC